MNIRWWGIIIIISISYFCHTIFAICILLLLSFVIPTGGQAINLSPVPRCRDAILRVSLFASPSSRLPVFSPRLTLRTRYIASLPANNSLIVVATNSPTLANTQLLKYVKRQLKDL